MASGIHYTILARAFDGLPLTASQQDIDPSIDEFKKLCRLLSRRLGPGVSNPLPGRGTIQLGNKTIHYVVELGVAYIGVFDKAYPRLLAFSFLHELELEFTGSFATNHDIQAAIRPYAFIRFETFLQATKRRYLNPRTLRTRDNLGDLSSKLATVPAMKGVDVFGPEVAPQSYSNVSQVLANAASIASSSLANVHITSNSRTSAVPVMTGLSTLLTASIVAIDLPFALAYAWEEETEPRSNPDPVYLRRFALLYSIASLSILSYRFYLSRRKTPCSTRFLKVVKAHALLTLAYAGLAYLAYFTSERSATFLSYLLLMVWSSPYVAYALFVLRGDGAEEGRDSHGD